MALGFSGRAAGPAAFTEPITSRRARMQGALRDAALLARLLPQRIPI